MDINNRPDSIEDVLAQLHAGQWFTFASPSDGKDRKHTHANLRTLDERYEKPTAAFLNGELAAMQTEWDAENAPYRLSRKVEYLSVEDQLDMLGKDLEDGGTRLRDHRRSVKNKHPKPGD